MRKEGQGTQFHMLADASKKLQNFIWKIRSNLFGLKFLLVHKNPYYGSEGCSRVGLDRVWEVFWTNPKIREPMDRTQ